MRTFIIIISILFSHASLACYAPRGGQEFDDLIKLEKLSGLNKYRVTVPRKLEDLDDPEIAIAYTKGGVTTYEDNETLIPSFTKEKRQTLYRRQLVAKRVLPLRHICKD
jgi:hypothetical protein